MFLLDRYKRKSVKYFDGFRLARQGASSVNKYNILVWPDITHILHFIKNCRNTLRFLAFFLVNIFIIKNNILYLCILHGICMNITIDFKKKRRCL